MTRLYGAHDSALFTERLEYYENQTDRSDFSIMGLHVHVDGALSITLQWQ